MEVREGRPRTHRLVLDAAHLTLHAEAVGPGGPVPEPAVEWVVQDLGQEREIASFSGTQASLYLEQGAYGISARHGGESLQEIVRLAPGAVERVDLRFEHAAAELRAPASVPAGSSIEAVDDPLEP